LSKLMTDGGPTLFRWDTSQTTIQQVTDQVLLALTAQLERPGQRQTLPALQNTLVK